MRNDGADDVDDKSDGASIGASGGASDADGTLDGAPTAASVDFPFLAALDTPEFLVVGSLLGERDGFILGLRGGLEVGYDEIYR